MANVNPHSMVVAIVFIFVIAILGAVFTAPLQDQVTAWADNLTANGQTAAAAVVSLIPLLFWVLLAVGIILVIVGTFLGGEGGLAVLPFAALNPEVLMVLVLALCLYGLVLAARKGYLRPAPRAA